METMFHGSRVRGRLLPAGDMSSQLCARCSPRGGLVHVCLPCLCECVCSACARLMGAKCDFFHSHWFISGLVLISLREEMEFGMARFNDSVCGSGAHISCPVEHSLLLVCSCVGPCLWKVRGQPPADKHTMPRAGFRGNAGHLPSPFIPKSLTAGHLFTPLKGQMGIET